MNQVKIFLDFDLINALNMSQQEKFLVSIYKYSLQLRV